MHWSLIAWRGLLHTLQLSCAITVLYIYKQTYIGITKDYRWTYAITTCAFTIIGTVIQAGFHALHAVITSRNLAICLVVSSGFCSGILFLFWTGVLGTFARTFVHRDSSQNHGVYMMKVAIYIDAAIMIIWFITVADAIGELIWLSNQVPAIVRTTNSESLVPGGSFVPHGWNDEDIEAQFLAIKSEDPALHATVELQPLATDRGSSENPLQRVTSQIRRRMSARMAADAGPAGSDELSLRPEEIQNFWSIYFDRDGPIRECSVCCEDRPVKAGFPSRIAKTCENHDQTVCRNCIDRNMEIELANNFQGLIHCIECNAVLDYEEIKALASPTTFVKYERMGLRGFVNNDPNFVWCQNPECTSGQEHVGGVDQPIVTCLNCGFQTCFKHQIPWHEEMLCDEYDERVDASKGEQKTRKQQELASLKTIHQYTKPCANKKCKVPIQKTKGCDHMICWKCKHEFCWICGGDWKRGSHQPGCPFQ